MSDAVGGGWTDERVETLGRLWGEGLSASQIATALGGGVTRNAVIGKVHRLGLAGRIKPGSQPAAPRKAKIPSAAVTAEETDAEPDATRDGSGAVTPVLSPPATEVALPVSRRVSILELRDTMCRWPLGDPTSPDFGFCGARSATGLPYCPNHCRIAYQPAAERRRIRA